MKKRSNPLRAWLGRQPPNLTQVELARRLGITEGYVSQLTDEGTTVTPSLALAVRIEDITGREVAPREIYHFVRANIDRKRKVEA